MFGLIKSGKDYYVVQGSSEKEFQEKAKSRRHELVGAVPDEKRWLLDRAAERQSEQAGGKVIQEPA